MMAPEISGDLVIGPSGDRRYTDHPIARFFYIARPANGSNAMFRACLIAELRRR